MLDLDARLAERDEKPKEVRLGGKVWELPPKMPILFAGYLGKGEFDAAIEMLFGPGAVAKIGRLIDLDLLKAMAEEVYGEELGELRASAKS